MPRLALFIAACLASSSLYAQAVDVDPDKNPVAIACRKFGESGFKQANAPDPSPTKFKPTGSRAGIKAVVALLEFSGDDAKQLENSCAEFIAETEKEHVANKLTNDVSTALAGAIAVDLLLSTGKEVSDKAMLSLTHSLQAALNTEAVRKATDAEKEFYFEYVHSTTFMIMVMASGKGDEAIENAMVAAELQLDGLFSTTASNFAVSDSTVTLKARADALAESLAPGFKLNLPKGWEDQEGWLVKETKKQVGEQVLTSATHILPLPAIEADGDMSRAVKVVWETCLPEALQKKAGTMVHTRYVGNQLKTSFVFARVREPGYEYDSMFTVYLVDCKTHWQPFVVINMFIDSAGATPKTDPAIVASYLESAKFAEEFFAAVTCTGAEAAGLATVDELAGTYSVGDKAQADWGKLHSGPAAMGTSEVNGTLKLSGDGTCSYQVTEPTGSVAATGTWKVESNQLVCSFDKFDDASSSKPQELKFTISGLHKPSGSGKVLVLAPSGTKANCTNLSNRAYWFVQAG